MRPRSPSDGAKVSAEEVFSGRTAKAIDTDEDVEPLLKAMRECQRLEQLQLQGYSFGVRAAELVGTLLGEKGSSMDAALWSDIFVSRTKEEVPLALSSLMSGLIKCGATLTLLDLSNNAFGAQGVQSVVNYLEGKYSANLTELNLTNTGLGIGGAKVLSSALSKSPLKLKVLRIGRNRLENEGSIALAKVLKTFSTLEIIEMPQNGIYYPGFEALSTALAANLNLRELIFSDNTIGPNGSKSLMEVLPRLNKLELLYLDDCLLKSQGAKYILEALESPNLPRLKELNLGSNDITDSIGKTSLEKALFWRSYILITLNDNELSKPIRDHLILGVTNCESSEIWFGDDDDLQDYYDDEEDEDDDDDYADDNSQHSFDNDVSQHTSDEEVDDEEIGDSSFIPTTIDDAIKSPSKQSDDVTAFLLNTSKENFCKLGDDPIKALLEHLDDINDDVEYTDEIVQMIFKLSLVEEDPKEIINNMKQWEDKNEHRASILANAFLVHLGLMKSEEKNKKICGNTEKCVKSFTNALKSSEFSPKLREMILFVIKDKCSKEKTIGNVGCGDFMSLLSE